jgi:methyl-accepting chemotaxis protein
MAFKLRTKLLAGFLVVAAIAGVIGSIGIVNMINIDNKDTLMYTNMTVPITNLLYITEYFQRVRINLRELLLAKTESEIREIEKAIDGYSEQIVDNANKFEKSILTEAGKQEFNHFVQVRNVYRGYLDQILTLVKAGRLEEANALISGDAYKAAMAEQEAIDGLVKNKIDLAGKTSAENSQSATISVTIMVTFTILGVVISVILGLWLGILVISKPLIKISDTLKNGSGQIALASNQLSSSSQEIANGATEQASSIEETTSSMEELASMVKQNVTNAQEASNLAEKASASSKDGYAQMEKMLESMTEINKSSDQIKKIIKVIDDIAFQTNILALNAAVEAARAGEAGMGFAVVADEVKNLANRSAEAAKETSSMIEDSIKRTEAGVQIASKMADVFKDILATVLKVTEMSREVETASKQQDSGINQVNKAIVQFDEVVQANASSAEETASSAEELLAQVENLNEVVKQLVKLVNGKAAEIEQYQRPERQYAGQHKESRYDSKKKLALKATKTSQHIAAHTASTAVGIRKREVSPEKFIPFEDDEDLKE